MPLSRHLYEIDEVRSALRMCLRVDDPQALFWLWELVVSKEEAIAALEMEDAVIRWGDPLLFLEYTPTDWIDCYIHVRSAFCKQNATQLLVTCRRPTKSTEHPGEKEFILGLKDACTRKNLIAATWFIRSVQDTLSADTIWKILMEIDPRIQVFRDKAHTREDEEHLIFQVAGMFIVCNPSGRIGHLPDTTEEQRRWDEWYASVDRRRARVYAIPETALDSSTTRGGISTKYTNIEDIRDPVGLLSEGCQFWQEVVEITGITINSDTNTVCFPSDDVLERFYATYFLDDIPDEWSKEDQEKSHGRGVKKS